METCGHTGGTGWPPRGQGAGRRPSDGAAGPRMALRASQPTSKFSGHWIDQEGHQETLLLLSGTRGPAQPSHLITVPLTCSPCAFSTLPTPVPHLTAVFEPKYHFYLSQAADPANPCSPPRGLKLPVSFLDQTLPKLLKVHRPLTSSGPG